MKHLQLQPRLRLLADLVPQGARLADIGTDHGYLPVWLMQQGRITSAIAADIGPEPLAHARRTAEEYGAALDLRLCDGLRGIAPHEADTVVMAGMGGETIIHILTDSPWPRDTGCTLLLQPQTKVELLRRWISENGYVCRDERLVWDKGKLYVVLQMTAGEPFTPDEARLYGGLHLEGDPLYGDYLDAQLRRLRRRLDGLGQTGTAQTAVTVDSTGSVVVNAAGQLTNDPSEPISKYLYGVGTPTALCSMRAGEIARVDYWLYLEGCDTACIMPVQERQLALQLGFIGRRNDADSTDETMPTTQNR